MSFTGIINTVLVGIIIAVDTNKDIQNLLLSSSFYLLIITVGMIGFICYILTSIFSLLAFREPKWMRVPNMPDENPISSIIDFFKDSNSYQLKLFAFQHVDAIENHQKTNDRKYFYLKFATLFLVSGIGATVIGAMMMLYIAGNTAQLYVITSVDNKLNSKTGYVSSDFIIRVNGNTPSLSEFTGSNNGTTITLRPGAYAVIVSALPEHNYRIIYSSECTGIVYESQNRICNIMIF
jgi:hypothetical protein